MAEKRAAIWARVSTSEQETANQLLTLREWAASRGFEVVREYTAEASAWTGKHKPLLATALEDARLGRFDVLLCWALDRLSREGIEATLSLLRQFRDLGADVWSLQEPWTEVNGPTADLLGAILAWVAQQESVCRSERIKAGLARRRAEGKPVGRQPGTRDRKPRKRSGYVAAWEDGGRRRAAQDD